MSEAQSIHSEISVPCMSCGRTLNDAVSQEIGIGPICREKMGYSADVGGDRDAVNKMIFTCALYASQGNLDGVLEVVENIKAEGFTKLAEGVRNTCIARLTNGNIVVESEGNMLNVKFAYNTDVIAQVKKVAGRKFNSATKNWTIPASSLAQFKEIFNDKCVRELGLFEVVYNVGETTEAAITVETPDVESKIYVDGNAICVEYPFNKEINNYLFTEKAFAMWNNAKNRREIDIAKARQYNQLDKRLDVLVSMVRTYKSNNWKFDAAELKALRQREAVKTVAQTITFDHLKLEPYDFQKKAIQFIEDNDGVAFLGLDMGLGKSLCAIAYSVFHNLKTLIICPASLKLNWANEVAKFTDGKTVAVFNGKTPTKEEMENADFTIINYDILKKHKELLKSVNFDLVSCDESHYIKNPKAMRTKATLEVVAGIEKKVFLSGTAICNRPSEFFTQLNALRPDIYRFSKFTAFAYEFCDPTEVFDKGNNKLGTDFSGASNLPELYKLISPFYIRMEKTEVLTDLPAKTFTDLPVYLEAKAKAAYNRIKKGINKKVKGDVLRALNEMRHMAAIAKIKNAIEFIETTIENDQKIVVFTGFTKVVEGIMAHFGDKAVSLTGKNTTAQARQAPVDAFQNNPEVKVFVGNTQACAEGITLTSAYVSLVVDLPWNSGKLSQLADRTCRIGQKNAVQVYKLIATGTIEEDINELLKSKELVVSAALTGKATATDVDRRSIQEIIADRLFSTPK